MTFVRSLFTSLFALSLLAAAPIASAFDEGIEYRKLELPEVKSKDDKILIQEFFWYGCPHCYSMDPYVKEWKKTLPDNVVFEDVPAPLNPTWALHARGYYAAQQLGVADKAHTPLFQALHDKKERIFDRQSLADFYAAQGVDREDFLKRMASFGVDSKVRRAGSMARRYQLDSVPSFVVNGIYVTSPSQAGSNQKALAVIDHILKQLGAK